ncbi:hypothetical protein E2C01_070489 [Portunus trituberculatus]|uniref:Uncharacterized protein n=1 Tax=Portunus trituberculatus TaxID=210409 RepID=A0A5B7I1Q6_PORTR|nr:hypothetical protein [Portunus trituberculatus]
MSSVRHLYETCITFDTDPLRVLDWAVGTDESATGDELCPSLLSALAITTLDLPTLLAASGVHCSWQPAVLRLTCAFLRKTGQLPRL